MTRGNLFTSNKCINDPLETFLALDHFDDELSFDDLVVLENVWLKLLITTANLSNNVVRLLLKMNFVDSHQVKGTFDVHDWNCDVMLFNQSLQVHFEFDIFSRNELDWWF